MKETNNTSPLSDTQLQYQKIGALPEKAYRLLDLLADGQWRPLVKLKTLATAEKISIDKKELKEFYDKQVEEGFLIAGANSSYRFVSGILERYRSSSPTLSELSTQYEPRYFGGILEDDGWAYAPLKTCNLIHFRADTRNLTKDKLVSILQEPDAVIQLTEDELYKIYSTEGLHAYDIVKNLKETHPEYEISGVRIELELKRRDVSELPPRFFDDLCKFYGVFTHALVRNQKTIIQKHLPDEDDVQQQLYLWIIEAVKRYNHETSIPFAAFLSSSLKRWVHDLNRQAYGRALADKELRHAKIVNAFRQEHERNPNTSELAELLNLSEDTVKSEREDIYTVVNLRNQQALEVGEYELPIKSDATADGQLISLDESSTLSRQLVEALRSPDGSVKMVGLVALYYQAWGAETENKKIRTWLRNSKVKREALVFGEHVKKKLTEAHDTYV